MRRQTALLAMASGIGILAALTASPASAQVSAGADGAAAPAKPTTEIGEVVVTASKRSEILRDVPSAISAIDASTLSKLSVTKLADIVGYLPSVTLNGSGIPGIGYIGFRGISPSDDAGATTAVYVDDSPVSRSSPTGPAASSNLDLSPYDLDRIEVLRGPQGTLYGANSLGGLIKYVTKKPSLTEFDGEVGGEVWGMAHSAQTGWLGRGVVNLPLVNDTLGLRVSFGHRDDPGYIDNVASGGERDFNRGTSDQYRVALRYAPTKDLTVDLSFTHQENDYGGQARIGINSATGQPSDGPYAIRYVAPVYSDQTYSVLNGTVNWNLGWATLTSATGYSKSKWDQGSDLTASYSYLPGRTDYVIDTSGEKFVQEVRLASPADGKINWLVGAYYTRETFEESAIATLLAPAADTPVAGVNPLATFPLHSTYEEYSGFGNATLKISDEWDIGAGLRVAHTQTDSTTGYGGSLLGSLTTFGGKGDDTTTLWSATARYRPFNGTMLYARAATGFRPGGANNAYPGAPTTFQPDRTTSYELGVKSEFADHRAYVEGAVFLIDWSNIQLTESYLGLLPYTVNAGTARSQGFELSGQYRPINDLTLSAGVSYSDAKLRSVNAIFTAGHAGDPLPLVTPWSANATVDWTFAQVRDWQFDGRVGARYVDSTTNKFQDPTGLPIPSATMIDASIDVSNGRYKLGLFARNLTDKQRIYLTSSTSDVVGEPRVIGVRIDAKY